MITQGVVGKFAKLEVLSHHGTEHYCPISLFKVFALSIALLRCVSLKLFEVFGISEIDLITEDMDPTPVEEEDDEPGTDPKEPNIMQTIKDAVHKVVNVFRPKNVTLALQTNGSQLAGASLRFSTIPIYFFLQVAKPQARSLAHQPLPREKAGGDLPARHAEGGPDQLQQDSWTLALTASPLSRAGGAPQPFAPHLGKASLDLVVVLESCTWRRPCGGSLQHAKHQSRTFNS